MILPNAARVTADTPVVYERKLDGHRRNYAETIGKVLGATVVLGPSPGGLRTALTARYLVITTLESAPMFFFALVLARAIVRRRSTVIATRWHVASGRRSARAALRRLAHITLLAVEPIQVLSITPPTDDDHSRTPQFIEDVEFWDLPQPVFDHPPTSDLATAVATARHGRKTIVVLGTLERSKGLLFLESIFAARPELAQHYIIVCCGEVMAPSRADLEPLRLRATVWVDRFLTRDELLSLYPVADIVWCCYDPSYDVSSGVFGRALQLGRPTLTRTGSIVARIAGRAGHGESVAYADVDGAAAVLLRRLPAPPRPRNSRFDTVSTSLRRIIMRHLHRS